MRSVTTRWRAGATAWLATLVLFPAQVAAAIGWPGDYSITDNAISDLGVTRCGLFVDGGFDRDICSPAHAVFNAGMIATGALTVAGALLLIGRWGSGAGRTGMILMAVAGVFVAVVGFVPWDVNPQAHDLAALAQAAAQWLGMVALAKAAGPGAFRIATLITVVVSILGFVAFVNILGTELNLPGLGIAERVSFDILTLWTALTGVFLLAGGRVSTAVVARSTGTSR